MKMEIDAPEFEWVLKTDNDRLTAVGVVDKPAILQDFITMSSKEPIKLKEVGEKEMVLCGPLLIPGMRIYREDWFGNPYYGFFRRDTVKQLTKKFFKESRNHNLNIGHDAYLAIEDCYIYESWLVGDQGDKSKELGFNLPPGTLMISVQCTPEVYNEYVATGQVNGFSMEAFLSAVQIDMANFEACNVSPAFVELASYMNAVSTPEERNQLWVKNCVCPNCLELRKLGLVSISNDLIQHFKYEKFVKELEPVKK